MNWRNLFTSRHTLWLEQEFENLKKAHAIELAHAITEADRYRDEAQRLRLYLTPALQNVQLDPDRSAPPSPAQDVDTGTPWMRILRKAQREQEEEAARKFTKPADAPVKGESNGNDGERRNATSLSE